MFDGGDVIVHLMFQFYTIISDIFFIEDGKY